MRRGTFQAETVDYAAVGATQAPELMGYPPERSVPAESSWRIGSGADRFHAASEALLAWGALKGAGLAVTDVRPAAGPMYSGVSFDDEGRPVAPPKTETDLRFDAEGTPFVSPGTSVKVRGRVGRYSADADLRVIFVVEQARRVGFALGTVGDSVVSGEESFMLDWRENDEVWFTVRAFDAPLAWPYRISSRLLRARRRALFTSYLRAISPLYASRS